MSVPVFQQEASLTASAVQLLGIYCQAVVSQRVYQYATLVNVFSFLSFAACSL